MGEGTIVMVVPPCEHERVISLEGERVQMAMCVEVGGHPSIVVTGLIILCVDHSVNFSAV
jgi:hypothetical protein